MIEKGRKAARKVQPRMPWQQPEKEEKILRLRLVTEDQNQVLTQFAAQSLSALVRIRTTNENLLGHVADGRV